MNQAADARDTALAPSVAIDTTLPRFAVPTEIRDWGARHAVATRRPVRAALMLTETVLWYAAFVGLGEFVGTWWGWILAWVGLVACMMRIDAIHHEGVHRSLFRNRVGNDVVAIVSGALEGFHAPMYRCFHLAHHALTRRSGDPSDPEDFYDEVITQPMQLGPVTLPARGSYLVGNLLGGITFAVQLGAATISTMLGRPPAYVRTASLDRYVRRWGLAPFAVWGAIVAAALLTDSVRELLLWWIVPMILFLAGPYTFFALSEHYGAAADAPMIVSTGSVESNAVYRWITLDGNYHLAHHVFPNASWWWLRPADEMLRPHTELHYTGYLSFHRQVWSAMKGRSQKSENP